MARWDVNLGEWDDFSDIPQFWVADFPSWAALGLAAVATVIAIRALRRLSYIEFHHGWTIHQAEDSLIVEGRATTVSDAAYIEASGRVRVGGKWITLIHSSAAGHAIRRNVVILTLVALGELGTERMPEAHLKITVSDGASRKAKMRLKVV